MKKQTNQCWQSLLLTTVTILGVSVSIFAQNQPPQFKVGDRVEVDTLQSSSHPEKSFYWRKGTIIKISDPDDHFGTYTVKIDKDGREMYFRFIDTQWMRPLKEAAAKDTKTQPKDENEAKDDQEPAKEEPAANACQPSDDTGGKTQSDIFKRLIRARWEHQPKEERDFTTTVTFQTFKLGATYKWRAGVHAGTIVYPVKASYTVCADYPGYKPTGFRGEIQKHQDNHTFNCFKNKFGEWECILGEGRTGDIQFIKK